ncbi:hypothetical protein C1967_12840 [Salmonella enterica]|nr:hypothetical protein [Salmonella enterica]ECF8133673.1 hypothetical protein [Salmonella enterica]
MVYAPAANGSQTGEGYNHRGVQQVPAKRQNRGPGNSTGDGFLKAKQVQEEEQHERGADGFTRRHLYPRTG